MVSLLHRRKSRTGGWRREGNDPACPFGPDGDGLPVLWPAPVRSRSWRGPGRPKHRTAKLVTDAQRHLDVGPMPVERVSHGFLRLADPVLDGVLVQHELIGGGG